MLVRLIRDWFHSQCQESEKQGNSRNHPEDQFKKSQSLIFWLSLSFQLLIYQISVFTQVLCSITGSFDGSEHRLYTLTLETRNEILEGVSGFFVGCERGRLNLIIYHHTGRPHTQTRGNLQRLSALTSLKCWLVFMMYGVLSDLSTFIQPWPRNSLQDHSRTHTVWSSGDSLKNFTGFAETGERIRLQKMNGCTWASTPQIKRNTCCWRWM